MSTHDHIQVESIQFVNPEQGDFPLIALSPVIDFSSDHIGQAQPSSLAIANDTIIYLDITFLCLILFRGLAAILSTLETKTK